MFNRLTLVWLGVLLGSGAAFAAERPWSLDLEAAAGKNTNIGNAEHHRDTVSDKFGVLTGGANYRWDFGPQAVTVRAFAEGEYVNKVEDLSRATAGGKVGYQRQLGSLPTSPTFAASVTAQIDDYKVKQRDSTVVTTRVSIAKPIGARASLSVGGEYFYRDSKGSVWDLSHWRGFLGGDVNVWQGWTTYATYSFIKGDVASTAQTRLSDGSVPDSIFGLLQASKALEPDDAFNNQFSNSQWTAYRLSATSNAARVGIKKEFANDFTLDISAFSVWVNAKADNKYDTQIYRASLQKRF
ncbi:MAG: hypothetical protein PVF07_05340 [Thiogranum sp.]|jgi:hypothetical protein